MRIGVDASCWANGRGYGRFTRELVSTMVSQAPSDEWICFVDDAAAGAFDVEAHNVRLVHVAQSESPTRAAAADGYRTPADMLRFTRAVWRTRLDVFFSPSVYTYFPLPPGIPAVVAIHDTIPERFPELTLPTKRARLFWNGKVRLALAQAKLVLTVSAYSADEIETVLGVPRDRIRIAMPAPAAEYSPAPIAEARAAAARHGVPEGEAWFTYVGGFNPHKRVASLVRAHAALVARGERAHLLLVGSLTSDVFHDNVREIRAAIETAGTGDLVHWTGFVDDGELQRLHSGAAALVLVSALEGFGLPAVEAGACGTPVIATRASPLPDILAGGGFFVEPEDTDAIVNAMSELVRRPELRASMGAKALACARTLSWSESGRSALDALYEAAGMAVAAAN